MHRGGCVCCSQPDHCVPVRSATSENFGWGQQLATKKDYYDDLELVVRITLLV